VEKASSGDYPFKIGVREEKELVNPLFCMSVYIEAFPRAASTSMNSYPFNIPLM